MIRSQRQRMVIDVRRAGQVEIAVLRQIAYRRRITGRGQSKDKLILLQLISAMRLQRARKSVNACGLANDQIDKVISVIVD